MLNLVNSPLKAAFFFRAFNTSRPPKRDTVHNHGYATIFQGGIGRMLRAASTTAWNVLRFPFAVQLQQIDIVQVQASDYLVFWESLAYVLLSRVLCIPVIMRIGGSFNVFYDSSSGYGQKLIRWAIRRPDRLMVQSKYWFDFVSNIGRRGGVFVLPNSVPDQLVTRPRIDRHARVVGLFIATNVAIVKGVDEFLEAVRTLQKRKVDVQFRCVGVTSALLERLDREGFTHLLEIAPYLSQNQILDIMAESDLFLMPSRSEGFPNTLIEAMALGMAPIVTPVGAIPEIVGADGAITVPVKEAQALADAIEQLAGDDGLRWRIATRARQIVAERYVQSKVLGALAAEYQSLLAEKVTDAF